MRRDALTDRVSDPRPVEAADVAAHAHSDLLSAPYGPADVVTFLAAVVSAVAPADARADRGAQRRTDALSDDVAAIVAADVPAHRRALSVADRRADGAADVLAGQLQATDCFVVISAEAPCKDAAMLERNIRMMRAVTDALAEAQPAHLIYVSSDAVYADSMEPLSETSCAEPGSLHGVMHLARELMLKDAMKGPLATLRPTLIYGAADPHNGYGPNRFRRLAADGQTIDSIVPYSKGFVCGADGGSSGSACWCISRSTPESVRVTSALSAGALAFLISALAIFAVAKRTEPAPLSSLGWSEAAHSRAVILGLGLYLLFLPAIFGAGLVSPWLVERFGGVAKGQEVLLGIGALEGGTLVYAMFLAVLVMPLFEELLFRAFLQPLLIQNFRETGGVVLTSALFAFIHTGWVTFLPIFCLSLLLGALYLRTRSLTAVVLIHGLHNAIVLSLFLASEEWRELSGASGLLGG